MERADSVAERTPADRADSCGVEAVTLSKVTEGKAVALFVESVGIVGSGLGFGLDLGGSRGSERGASWLFLRAAWEGLDGAFPIRRDGMGSIHSQRAIQFMEDRSAADAAFVPSQGIRPDQPPLRYMPGMCIDWHLSRRHPPPSY